MNTNEFISIKSIISDLYFDSTMSNCPIDFIINKTVELIGICGSPSVLQDKEDILHISKYKALLPCDFYEVNQMRLVKLDGKGNYVPYDDALLYSTATFNPDITKTNNITYKIQNSVAVFSLEKGEVLLSYKAFVTDDEGFPMIVNNQNFIRALESYIVFKWTEILFRQGKIAGQILQQSQSEYEWNIGNAMNNMATPTLDQMESIAVMLNNTFLPSYHKEGFDSMNIRDTLKKH